MEAKNHACFDIKDLEDFIDPREHDVEISLTWKKRARKAQALTGLSLSDQILESTREVTSCHEVWKIICEIFERHTILNKLSARCKFYIALKHENESVLSLSNRIPHNASTLKSMSVDIPESEKAIVMVIYWHLV